MTGSGNEYEIWNGWNPILCSSYSVSNAHCQEGLRRYRLDEAIRNASLAAQKAISFP